MSAVLCISLGLHFADMVTKIKLNAGPLALLGTLKDMQDRCKGQHTLLRLPNHLPGLLTGELVLFMKMNNLPETLQNTLHMHCAISFKQEQSLMHAIDVLSPWWEWYWQECCDFLTKCIADCAVLVLSYHLSLL